MHVHLSIAKKRFASGRRSCSEDRLRLLTCADFAVHDNNVAGNLVGFRWQDYDVIMATDLLRPGTRVPLPCDIQLPVRLPFQPAAYETTVDWCTPTAYVALFRAHPGVLDLDEIAVPSGWWAEVFIHGTRSDQVGNVRIEGDMLLNYPDAIEVAAAMQAGARGNPPAAGGLFQHELDWAYELGLVFLENCRYQFTGSVL